MEGLEGFEAFKKKWGGRIPISVMHGRRRMAIDYTGGGRFFKHHAQAPRFRAGEDARKGSSYLGA